VLWGNSGVLGNSVLWGGANAFSTAGGGDCKVVSGKAVCTQQ